MWWIPFKKNQWLSYKKCPNKVDLPVVIFNFSKILCGLPSTLCLTGELWPLRDHLVTHCQSRAMTRNTLFVTHSDMASYYSYNLELEGYWSKVRVFWNTVIVSFQMVGLTNCGQAAAPHTPTLCQETKKSCLWFPTNTVTVGLQKIPYASWIKFFFSGGWDKFIIFIWV